MAVWLIRNCLQNKELAHGPWFQPGSLGQQGLLQEAGTGEKARESHMGFHCLSPGRYLSLGNALLLLASAPFHLTVEGVGKCFGGQKWALKVITCSAWHLICFKWCCLWHCIPTMADSSWFRTRGSLHSLVFFSELSSAREMMFLSGSEEIYSDFYNGRMGSSLEPVILSISFAKGQGGVMDNQDLGMTSPDSSLSHCVNSGKQINSNASLFSHSSTVPPTPFPSIWEDHSFWPVSGRAHWVGMGGRGHLLDQPSPPWQPGLIVDITIGSTSLLGDQIHEQSGAVGWRRRYQNRKCHKGKKLMVLTKRERKGTKMSKAPQSVLPTRWQTDDAGLWRRRQLKDRWEHTRLSFLIEA